MGKDSGGDHGFERTVRVEVVPDKVFIIEANNNQDYEDYRKWNCYFMTLSEEKVKAHVKALNEEITELAKKAEFHFNKIDYARNWEETAPGKRYLKFLRDKGIIDKYSDEPSTCYSPIIVSYHELERRN